MASYSIHQASKSYGDRPIFSDISLSFKPGVYYTLIGPNGSGKSTLMSCLLHQEKLSQGSVLLDGEKVTSTSQSFRLQVFGLNDLLGWLPGVTVGQHLELLARESLPLARGLGEDPSTYLTAQEALTELGISQAYQREPQTLSSGQEQRARLASLLIRPARYYFLDEPEKRLDKAGLDWIADWVQAKVAGGASVCIATHEPSLTSLPYRQELIFPLAPGKQGTAREPKEQAS